MTTFAPRPRDDRPRTIKRILFLLAGGTLVVVAAASHVAYTYYRQYRHKADFDARVRVIDTEWEERERFKDHARARLLAGDFDGLDALARELRASRATFPNGAWKLSVLYQGLGGPAESAPWSEPEWARALDQSQRWVGEHPDSTAARLVAADLWISYAWVARGNGWSHEVAPERHALFRKRMERAASIVNPARRPFESCPRRADRLLTLALAGLVDKAEEAATFEQAIRDEPDYQPAYSIHLRYLQPRWHGAAGELQRAVTAVSKLPGGHEKVARAVWYFDERNSFDTGTAPWPVVKRGFADMRARYPDSLEVLSASCLFAAYYRDRDETKRLFQQLGGRMVPGVWRGRERFVNAYFRATFEQEEVRGGDPLARFFAWLMGS